jgi:hypothetical protein
VYTLIGEDQDSIYVFDKNEISGKGIHVGTYIIAVTPNMLLESQA